MVQLYKLAQRYQRALDSPNGPNWSGAAKTAFNTLHRAMKAARGADTHDLEPFNRALRPIILQTTLATLIVAYLERIPWASLTPQILCGQPFSAAPDAAKILWLLSQSTWCENLNSRAVHNAASLLFTQRCMPACSMPLTMI